MNNNTNNIVIINVNNVICLSSFFGDLIKKMIANKITKTLVGRQKYVFDHETVMRQIAKPISYNDIE
jgi:uncharacterized protein (DUF697 family)